MPSIAFATFDGIGATSPSVIALREQLDAPMRIGCEYGSLVAPYFFL